MATDPSAADFNNLVPLAEIISEILSVGPKSKSVNAVIDRLVAAFGSVLAILQEVPGDDLAGIGAAALTGAISRLRRDEVIKDAGYDGEYLATPATQKRLPPDRRLRLL
jgi:PHP family Zn ribbon phosphoesterase